MIQERFFYLDNLRGIAIVLVVIGHVLQNTLTVEYNHSFLFQFIYSFHMPLFMFISGAVYRGEFSYEWILKRLRILFLPFVVWSFIYYLYNKTNDPFIEYWISILKEPDKSLWFLLILFYCSMFALPFTKIKYWQEILFILALTVQAVPCSEYGMNLFRWMFFYFALGCLYNKYYLLLFKSNVKLVFVAFVLSLICEIGVYNIDFKYVSYLKAIFPITILCIFSYRYLNAENQLLGHILGQNTLQIYVSHFLFIYVYVLLFKGLPRLDVQVLVFLMTILSSLLLSYMVKRNKIANVILFGGK